MLNNICGVTQLMKIFFILFFLKKHLVLRSNLKETGRLLIVVAVVVAVLSRQPDAHLKVYIRVLVLQGSE